MFVLVTQPDGEAPEMGTQKSEHERASNASINELLSALLLLGYECLLLGWFAGSVIAIFGFAP